MPTFETFKFDAPITRSELAKVVVAFVALCHSEDNPARPASTQYCGTGKHREGEEEESI
jgi:hypothetical protein